MVAVPSQTLVSMSWLSIYSGKQTAISLWDDKSVQEGHRAICSGVLGGEMYGLIYGIDV